jgi:hypothetical protein
MLAVAHYSGSGVGSGASGGSEAVATVGFRMTKALSCLVGTPCVTSDASMLDP